MLIKAWREANSGQIAEQEVQIRRIEQDAAEQSRSELLDCNLDRMLVDRDLNCKRLSQEIGRVVEDVRYRC